MSKGSSRDIRKRLFEFARNEFENKQPEYVEVRKAKGSKTFYRGPVPQIILTRYKAIAYTVFADYGSLCRLYYFNKDGYCVSDSSYSEQQLDKIKTHLLKTTVRVLRYPKIEIKPKIGNLAVKLDNRFAEIIEEIEKLTKLKLPSRPVITLNSNLELDEENYLKNIVRDDEFIELPAGIENTEFAEIILVNNAFFEFTKLIFGDKTIIASNNAQLLTLFFLNENLLSIFMKRTDISYIFPKNFELLNRKKEIPKFMEILTDYNYYLLSGFFIDSNLKINNRFHDKLIHYILSDFTLESDSKIRLANALLKEIPNFCAKEDFELAARFLVIAAFLGAFSKKIDKISTNILEISQSFSSKIDIVVFTKKFVSDLYSYRIESLINYWRKNQDLFPDSVNIKFDELTDIIFKKIIQIQIEFTTEAYDKPGDIIIKIRNKSDTTLGSLAAEDIHWTPPEGLVVIGEKRKIKAKFLVPNEEYTLTIPIIPKKLGTINFRNLIIRFNDPFGIKHFTSLEIPSLKIKKG